MHAYGFDCNERVFAKLGDQARLEQPNELVRAAPPEGAPQSYELGLRSSFPVETLKSLEVFLGQANIPLVPGPEALTEADVHHKKWKSDVDQFFSQAPREKLMRQLEALYLDYLSHPPELADGAYLPGLDAQTPLKPQPLPQLFKDPDALRAHGLVLRTMKNALGFEEVLGVPAKDPEKQFRRVAAVRVNHLMVRIFEMVQKHHGAP